ncbi:MAG: T9SS type A sorting domain-containing protein [bacterium]|nr:T9SS type A sorting domain-containing protein [bacterium]
MLTSNKHRTKVLAFLTLVLLTLVASNILPASAQNHRCLQSELPKLDAPAGEIRAELKAADAWHRNATADRTPPPDPQVGDTWNWYIWDLGGMPVANLKPCTVRGMGDNCYIVVDDEEWNVGIDQTDVDLIVAKFESQSPGNWPTQGIWDLNTSHFGAPPNPLDGLERIFLLYYRFDISSDGYFWVFDQYPDGSQDWASNEADVIYMAVDNGDPAGDYMCAVAAHEFQHMIHFNTDSNESSWVDEGMGELAMWLFGNPDQISSFNTNPDNSLITWDGNWADYIQTYLWSLYMYEQFGGQPFIWDVCHNTANGMAGFESVLTTHGFEIDAEEIFGNWSACNFLDDTTIADGRFGYVGEELPPFSAFRQHTSYPASGNGSVKNWGTDYIRLNDMPGVPIFTFNGQDTRDFRVALMAVDALLPTVVRFVELDGVNDGSLSFTEAQGYDQVIVSIANVYNYSAGTYTYEVEMGITGIDDENPSAALALSAYPNPFNPQTTFSFVLSEAAEVSLSIFDPSGRRVREIEAGLLGAGRQTLAWTADNLPSGLYLARLTVAGKITDETRVVLMK